MAASLFNKMNISNRISLDATTHDGCGPAARELISRPTNDPEPEAVGAKPTNYRNSWHLTVGTPKQEQAGCFLTVLMVEKIGQEDRFPKVKLLEGKGCLAVGLTYPDDTKETIAFRTRPDGRIDCRDLQTDARVAAVAHDGNGTEVRRLQIP